MYEEYRLKPNLRTTTFRHLIFFDTESKIEKEDSERQIHKLHLGVAQYYDLTRKEELRDEIVFFDGEDFVKWLITKTHPKRILYVFAHNIAFDFALVGIDRHLSHMGYSASHIFLEDNCVFVEYKGNDRTIRFLDTFNYVRLSVKEIGKAIGLEKIDLNPLNAPEDKLIEYCRRDVEIIAKFMIAYIKFFKENDLGEFAVTTPANAFNCFRHKFYNGKIYIHRHEKVIDLEKSSYFGGRTECFYVGKLNQKIYYLDINSMYPYVMKTYRYPVRLIAYSEDFNDICKLKEILNRYCVIAEVHLEVDEPAYPYRLKDRTIYPTGSFSTILTTPELQYAVNRNHVKSIRKIAVYRSDKIFDGYVDYFYQRRLEAKKKGNKLYDFLYKLLLNSLYGKFGQTVRLITKIDELEEEKYEIEEVINENGKKEYDLIYFGRSVFRKEFTKEPSRWAFLAIASHVTAYSRMLLWSYIQKAGKGHVFYCDTDSVFVDEHGKKNLESFIDNKELGKLKIEDVADYMEIRGLKDYIFGNKEKLKGIKKTAEKIDDRTFIQLQFPSFSKVIRQGMQGFVELRKQIKVLKREYNKGIVTDSGFVQPYRVQDNHIVQ